MKLRQLDRFDVPAAVALWNAHLGTELPLSERVLQLTLFDDPTFRAEDAIAAVADDALVGMAWLKRWRPPYEDPRFVETAFLGGLAVHPDHHRQGIGSALLDAFEQRMPQRREISGGLLHLLPGVPDGAPPTLEFLRRRGYVFDEQLQHDLIGNPATHGKPDPAARLATHADEVLEFLSRAFPGSWHLHARWHLTSGGKPDDFVVIEHKGRVEGFCHIFRPNAWPPGPSTFWSLQGAGLGPIGVSEHVRGQGLGGRLLAASLHELAHSGARTCVIDWTSLVDFYGKFGFRAFRAYRRAARNT